MQLRTFGGPVGARCSVEDKHANGYIDDDAKPMAAKYLTKWRPGFLEQNSDTKMEESMHVPLHATQTTASVST
jgi:hypothetical protein